MNPFSGFFVLFRAVEPNLYTHKIMSKKEQTNIFVVWAVVAVLVVGTIGIIWMARPSAQNQKTDLAASNSGTVDVFELSEPMFDFGEISMSKGKVNHTFQLKNAGTESVKLARLYTSCMCTSAILIKNGDKFGPFGMQGHGYIPRINKEFSPGDTAGLEVIFDPAAHGPAGVGYVERVVYLETSAGVQQIRIKATVKP